MHYSYLLVTCMRYLPRHKQACARFAAEAEAEERAEAGGVRGEGGGGGDGRDGHGWAKVVQVERGGKKKGRAERRRDDRDSAHSDAHPELCLYGTVAGNTIHVGLLNEESLLSSFNLF